METRPLRYFLAVAETRHFGQAAEQLHMARSPLSRAIRQLESQVGAALFTRTTRRVDLTAAARHTGCHAPVSRRRSDHRCPGG